jgi:hypothetical protein
MEFNTHAASNASNMILFERIKTGNPLLDTLVLTFLLSSVTNILKWLNINVLYNINLKTIFNYEKLYHYFSNKNVVEYEGKISCSTNMYDNHLHQSAAFSDRFKALWDHIINTVIEEIWDEFDDDGNGTLDVNETHLFVKTTL